MFAASTTIAQVSQALHASAIFIAVLVLLGVALSIPVMLRRWQSQIGLGTGGDATLLQRTRTHGNFIEHATLVLPLLGVAPFVGAPATVIYCVGGAMVVGRLLHAQGLSQTAGVSPGRALGMMLSWISLLGGAMSVLIYTLTTGTVLPLLAAG